MINLFWHLCNLLMTHNFSMNWLQRRIRERKRGWGLNFHSGGEERLCHHIAETFSTDACVVILTVTFFNEVRSVFGYICKDHRSAWRWVDLIKGSWWKHKALAVSWVFPLITVNILPATGWVWEKLQLSVRHTLRGFMSLFAFFLKRLSVVK